MREVYQNIYETKPWYGDSAQDRCPGFRFLPKYKDYLIAPVIDLGCGRGDTVRAIRAQGIDAHGFDFINLKNDMWVADITQPLDLSKFGTAISMDVAEHLTDEQCDGLFNNMKVTQRQVLSITNCKSTFGETELHINIKPFDEWANVLGKYFKIINTITIKEHTRIFLCEGVHHV